MTDPLTTNIILKKASVPCTAVPDGVHSLRLLHSPRSHSKATIFCIKNCLDWRQSTPWISLQSFSVVFLQSMSSAATRSAHKDSVHWLKHSRCVVVWLVSCCCLSRGVAHIKMVSRCHHKNSAMTFQLFPHCSLKESWPSCSFALPSLSLPRFWANSPKFHWR